MPTNPLLRLLCAAWLALAALPANALLDEVSWAGTRIVRVDGRELETRVEHARLMERIRAVVKGVEIELVVRYDRGLAWQMTPLLALAGETDISALDTPATIRVLRRERLGEESVGGRRATRYRVDYLTRAGERRSGEYWQDASGVHLRSRFRVAGPEGRERLVELELRDLRVGPQEPSLFELPAGYPVVPLDATELLRLVPGL